MSKTKATNTDKQPAKESLRTEPMAEKDEVKEAERRTANQQKKVDELRSDKK